MRRDGWSALYFSVPIRLKEQLASEADASGRTIAKTCEHILSEWFDRKVEDQCSSAPVSSALPHSCSSLPPLSPTLTETRVTPDNTSITD